MNDHLTKVSVLLLMFYMGWYIWDQNKVIQNQQDIIRDMQIQSFYDTIVLQQLRAQQNSKFYQKHDNPL